MLSAKEVQHIAKLARIQVSDKDIAKFQKELASILEYFEMLREVDVPDVQPMTHSVPSQNVSRKDVNLPSQDAERLLHMAPATKHGYLKVKSIFGT